MNKVIMLGRIRNAPVVKNFEFGSMANFGLETSDKWKDKNSGEVVEKKESHRIVASDPAHIKTLENAAEGDLIFIEGKLQTRKYKDKTGKENYITEVLIPKAIGTLMLIDKNTNEVEIQQKKPIKSSYKPTTPFNIDDEIPF
jgi:single-strand DNA-binding protein